MSVSHSEPPNMLKQDTHGGKRGGGGGVYIGVSLFEETTMYIYIYIHIYIYTDIHVPQSKWADGGHLSNLDPHIPELQSRSRS